MGTWLSLSYSMKVIDTTHLLFGCSSSGWWHPPVIMPTNPDGGGSPLSYGWDYYGSWLVGEILVDLLAPSGAGWNGQGGFV